MSRHSAPERSHRLRAEKEQKLLRVRQPRGGVTRTRQCFLRRASDRRDVTHLSSRSCLFLPVQVKPRASDLERTVERERTIEPEIAKQVHDRRWSQDLRIAQWNVADGAGELLELTRRAGELRLVIRIVR